MPSHYLPIDGINYHIIDEGPENAPIVLLTHALMSNHRMWDSTVAALHNTNHRTLRFDHIGHNLTAPPSDPKRAYTTDDITHHMHEIVKHFTNSQKNGSGSGSPNIKAVIGCSIGGVLALRYAMLYPSTVSVAISLCAPGLTSLPSAAPLWAQRLAQFETDVASSTDTLCYATVDRWIPGTTAHDGAVRREVLEQVRTCSLAGYRVLADAIRGYDYGGELGGVTDVKCVVVAGGRDGAVDPEVLRGVARSLTSPEGAEFVLLEEAGHLPPVQRAGEFEAVMLRALGCGV